MADGTCSIAGCERRRFAKGWCHAHYDRWSRTGDAGSQPIQDRPTTCSVEGCDRKHYGRGFCQTHLYRFRSNGDPLVTRSPGAPAGRANPLWRGDDVEYAAVHRRLKIERGRAKDHDCSSCGRRAAAWAYQHDAPDERICPKAGLPFTTDLSRYEPMCLPCHAQLDSRHGWPHPNYFGRGVSLDKRSGRWRAYATFNRKQYTAGRHDTAEQAAAAAHELRLQLLAGDERATA